MLVGSIASAAYAEVNLSGDARARYIYKDKYDFGNSDQDAMDYFDSRIRVKVEAKAKGGAFMKARMRFDDIKWDGQGWGAYKEDKNVWVDYAFIGAPMGPITLSAGRMPANFSKFFAWDGRPSRVKIDYKNGGFRLIGFYDIKDEFVNANDDLEDNDFTQIGIVSALKINDSWSGKVWLGYQNDDREYTGEVDDAGNAIRRSGDASGFKGAIQLNGKIGTIAIEGGAAYKDADAQGTADDGFGGYAQVGMKLGAFTPALQVGFTKDGYVADNDFGFIMIGAAEPITAINNVGNKLGDTQWAALIAKATVSENFKLAANLVYYDIDIDTDGVDVRGVMDAIEISGSGTYTISEGADFTVKAGYLSPSYDGRLDSAGVQDDGAFGAYARLAIKF